MQKTVRDQKGKFSSRTMAVQICLLKNFLFADSYISQHQLTAVRIEQIIRQFIRPCSGRVKIQIRKREHICYRIDAAMELIQLMDSILIT